MNSRDHGGGLDAAIARHGGARADWLDLSTGINPLPYPIPPLAEDAFTALPDSGAFARLEAAARSFWSVPDGLDILPAPGASALIARLPRLLAPGRVHIPSPTYNEHAAAFTAEGWRVLKGAEAPDCEARVLVHPNNPDGRFWRATELQAGAPGLTVIDESFCDVAPGRSHLSLLSGPLAGRAIILKSFGKFWGLAGLRLGFAIGAPALIAPLREALGPWQVSGPALDIGTAALKDEAWTKATRARLERDSARLDALLASKGTRRIGGTPLFRLYDVGDAAAWQHKLAEGRVLGRIFPYSRSWLRLGLPAPGRWAQLEAAL
ncbi:Threonine-phosphate decarboxylase [Pseudoruegeria aquimaris]|uniref:Aminotransferase n=1 Tax=Pseudoruegeria aquimaris TaxID=393663 RepID=A0A1Y5S512_9RHOB|nr:threonine-phosphate decarboxylase [Pseudoruegeria aquimaris]SLN29953.1 Threonine-phosphate decarboxylase [Pseudoruegeria aquimaris]